MACAQTAKKRIIAAERAEQVLTLRKAGATYHEIGKAVGVSEPRAYQICKARLRELNESCAEATEEMRSIECERLNVLMIRLQPGVKAGDVAAITEARKIGESKRKLFGLDAPTKQEVTGAGGAPCVIEVVYEKAAK